MVNVSAFAWITANAKPQWVRRGGMQVLQKGSAGGMCLLGLLKTLAAGQLGSGLSG